MLNEQDLTVSPRAAKKARSAQNTCIQGTTAGTGTLLFLVMKRIERGVDAGVPCRKTLSIH